MHVALLCLRERERETACVWSTNACSSRARATNQSLHCVSMAPESRKQHAVAIPLPAQGHTTSLMRFCKKLASQGFTITFVDIDPIYHRIEALQAEASASADQEGSRSCREKKVLDIRRAHVPIDGLDLSNGFHFSLIHFFEAVKGLGPHLEKLLHSLLASADPPVTCLISDLYMTTPSSQLAHKFNLPRIVFYPFSASMLLLMEYILHGHISQTEAMIAAKGEAKGVFQEGLPGLPTLNFSDLPRFKHLEDNNEFMYELTTRELEESEKGGFAMVVNSFKEVEDEALKVLVEHMKVPLYPIGPLVEELQEGESATSLWKDDMACMKWLDQRSPLSVLYISFGSITFLSHLQFEELVAGLLASNYHFLFVYRPNLKEHNPNSPTSPIEQILSNGKGYVAEWTPQLAVLSHPSVGGFLTHCGLNSIMEALIHGVPMLCWPYFADQFMNANFVVEKWKVGLPFCVDKEFHGSITRENVEKSIKALMEGEDGSVVRKNSKLKKASHQTLSPTSTSYKSLQDFVLSLQ